MISRNARLSEMAKIVTGYGPGTPSTSVSAFVSLKGYDRACIIIQALNGSTVTGSAITLTQAQDVSNTAGKALAFSDVRIASDTANSAAAVNTAVTSNTFTTNTTASKGFLFEIDVKAEDLDINNGFDCVRVNLATAANTTMGCTIILYPAKYGKADPLTPIVD